MDGFSDLERSLGIATVHEARLYEMQSCFSDLERSLGIATRGTRPAEPTPSCFSDLERSLGIATSSSATRPARRLIVSVTSNGR